MREYDVSRWERGKTKALPLLGMRRVCRVLGVDLEELADALLADANGRLEEAEARVFVDPGPARPSPQPSRRPSPPRQKPRRASRPAPDE